MQIHTFLWFYILYRDKEDDPLNEANELQVNDSIDILEANNKDKREKKKQANKTNQETKIKLKTHFVCFR